MDDSERQGGTGLSLSSEWRLLLSLKVSEDVGYTSLSDAPDRHAPIGVNGSEASVVRAPSEAGDSALQDGSPYRLTVAVALE